MLAKSFRGDANTRTKNWELRRVPLIPDARLLFERMRKERAIEPLDAKVFRVGECRKALDRACENVGADRITHHDLRHLFATRCIESGVDIPTVSRWLGHKDGGALAMKTIWPLAPRTQPYPCAAREFRAGRHKAGRRDRISSDSMTSPGVVCRIKEFFFSEKGWRQQPDRKRESLALDVMLSVAA